MIHLAEPFNHLSDHSLLMQFNENPGPPLKILPNSLQEVEATQSQA